MSVNIRNHTTLGIACIHMYTVKYLCIHASTKERQRACVNERGRDIKESENVWMNEQILSEVCVCVLPFSSNAEQTS